MAKKKKVRVIEAWMRAHPDDVPCPRDQNSARAWRTKRGLDRAGSQIAFLRSRIGAGSDPIQAQIDRLEGKS